MTLADQARLLRELLGIGLMDAKDALETAPRFGGDPVLAACVREAGRYAVKVKGDRAAWDLAKGRGLAREARARAPALDAAFPPKKETASFDEGAEQPI